MNTSRLEAFSDGVIAVIITIMVLELRAPADASFAALSAVAPAFLVYALSFIVVAIMWGNHHHLLHTARRATGRLIWANANLLFWMSLIPFVTAWMGTHPGAPVPVSFYGVVLALSGTAFGVLRSELSRQHHDDAALRAIDSRAVVKVVWSVTLYALAAALAFVWVYLSYAFYVFVAVSYFIPERQLERGSEATGRRR